MNLTEGESEVVRLRDEEGLSWVAVAKRLNFNVESLGKLVSGPRLGRLRPRFIPTNRRPGRSGEFGRLGLSKSSCRAVLPERFWTESSLL